MKPEVAAIGVAVKIVALLLQAHPAYSVDDVLLDLRATSSQTGESDNLLGWLRARIELEVGVVRQRDVGHLWSPCEAGRA